MLRNSQVLLGNSLLLAVVQLSFFGLSILCLRPSILRATDETNSTEIVEPTELAPFVLTLVDEANGKPIVGAEVQPYALRCEEDRGSHYGWPVRNAGKPKVLRSDAEGRVTIMYPTHFGTAPDWLTTSEISISVRHSQYIPTQFELDPVAGKASKQIVAGEEVAFSGVDDSGEQIEKLGILFAGPGGGAKWDFSDGMYRSRAIPNGRWQVMLVAPRDNGQHLFSSVLPVRLAKGRRVSIRDVKLRQGLRLRGRIEAATEGETFPQPVENGKVIAWCLPKPDGAVYDDENPSLGWQDTTELRPDGTFEFPSLPRGGKIQLIALCDGWLIINGPGHANRTHGVVYDLDDLAVDDLLDVTLHFEKTGNARVSVLKPDGSPLPNAYVATWPNQGWELGGSQILGESYSSVDVIRTQLGDLPRPDAWGNRGDLTGRYYQKTDTHGVAILRDIPKDRPTDFTVSHEEFVPAQPNNQNGFRNRVLNFVVAGGATVEVEVKMEAKPTK